MEQHSSAARPSAGIPLSTHGLSAVPSELAMPVSQMGQSTRLTLFSWLQIRPLVGPLVSEFVVSG